jgi:hypothetical protein
MIQPQTWKAIHDSIAPVWSVVGPFVGIGIGAWLGCSWDRKKWIKDKRAEECKELLTAMTKVLDIAMEARSLKDKGNPKFNEVVAAGWAEERKCLIVLQDRIFIQKELRENTVRKLWSTLVTDFLQDGDDKKFSMRINELKHIIIGIALKD